MRYTLHFGFLPASIFFDFATDGSSHRSTNQLAVVFIYLFRTNSKLVNNFVNSAIPALQARSLPDVTTFGLKEETAEK